MTKCALFVLLSLITSASSVVFSEKHILGWVTDDKAEISYYLEIKPNPSGYTVLINQSGSIFKFLDSDRTKRCDIEIFPDKNILYVDILPRCRKERTYHLSYEGQDLPDIAKTNSKKLFKPNKEISSQFKLGFMDNAKRFIITNKRRALRSNRLDL